MEPRWAKRSPRDADPGGGDVELEDTLDAKRRRPRIRCPRCAWEPRAEDRWSCVCGCVWNTFDTGGVCPECATRWEETQCLVCHRWSKHRAWYADEEPS